MHRLNVRLPLALLLCLALACGKKKPADAPSPAPDAKDPKAELGKEGDPGSAKKPPESEPEKKDDCLGFDIGDLDTLLGKSSCEEAGVKPDAVPAVDLKGKLEVTVAASPTKVPPGGKADLVVTFANKTKDILTLHFRIDPVARFQVEAFDKKGARVDVPPGKPPPPAAAEWAARRGSEPKTARVAIAANGTARVRVPWSAVKMKWAPEKIRGTPPEAGYPRSPAGPLPKGKYVLKVTTPLVGVAEADHEVSAPKVEIEIGG